jgi:hypothetical protein
MRAAHAVEMAAAKGDLARSLVRGAVEDEREHLDGAMGTALLGWLMRSGTGYRK